MFRDRPNDRRLAFAAFYVIPVDIKTISLQEFSSARIYSRFAEAMLSHWFQSWMTDQKPWAPQHDGLPFWIEKFAYIGANTQSPFSETLRLVETDVFLRTTEQVKAYQKEVGHKWREANRATSEGKAKRRAHAQEEREKWTEAEKEKNRAYQLDWHYDHRDDSLARRMTYNHRTATYRADYLRARRRGASEAEIREIKLAHGLKPRK